ncbi:MAG TPA: Na+/H+ antiporter NhaA, partial [Egibacteraceae bacterium]|nr:Na+/H+ antiporter NhaA [Egibacteraceae bacterium]
MSHGHGPTLSDEPGLGIPFSRRDALVPRLVVQPLQRFAQTETSAGVLLALMAIVALIWANSGWYENYHHLWETEIGLDVGGWGLHLTLHEWINDGAMAIFFFVVGMEIKRELVHGQLRDPRAAALPVFAAVGGMVVPALIYTALNGGEPSSNGWGIPMATDIAFAVGALSLVGKRLPTSLKIFLLTLAVADDLGAIAVIAIFYSTGVQLQWIGIVALTAAAVWVLQRMHVRWLAPYVVLALFLWFATHESGVHATIAGVVLGFLTPAHPFHPPKRAAQVLHRALDRVTADKRGEDSDVDEYELLDVARLSREAVSPLARLENALHPWSAYLILPLFALSNAGVRVVDSDFGELLTRPVTLGVMLGLVVGKPLGVVAASWIATKLRIGVLPAGVTWPHVTAVGLFAGIGFTVALFVSGLSFTDPDLSDGSKVGILLAS